MSRISEPSTYISESTFLMRSFRENLVERMDSRKLKSLNALGDDFFFLVDHLHRIFVDVIDVFYRKCLCH